MILLSASWTRKDPAEWNRRRGRPNSLWLAQLGDHMMEWSVGPAQARAVARNSPQGVEHKGERGEAPSPHVLSYLTWPENEFVCDFLHFSMVLSQILFQDFRFLFLSPQGWTRPECESRWKVTAISFLSLRFFLYLSYFWTNITLYRYELVFPGSKLKSENDVFENQLQYKRSKQHRFKNGPEPILASDQKLPDYSVLKHEKIPG